MTLSLHALLCKLKLKPKKDTSARKKWSCAIGAFGLAIYAVVVCICYVMIGKVDDHGIHTTGQNVLHDISDGYKWIHDHAHEYEARSDVNNMILMGYCSGAMAMSTLLHDRQYAEKSGFRPEWFRKMICVSGIYDVIRPSFYAFNFHKWAHGDNKDNFELVLLPAKHVKTIRHIQTLFLHPENDYFFLRRNMQKYRESIHKILYNDIVKRLVGVDPNDSGGDDDGSSSANKYAKKTTVSEDLERDITRFVNDYYQYDTILSGKHNVFDSNVNRNVMVKRIMLFLQSG